MVESFVFRLYHKFLLWPVFGEICIESRWRKARAILQNRFVFVCFRVFFKAKRKAKIQCKFLTRFSCFLIVFPSVFFIDLLTLVRGQPNFSLGFPPVGHVHRRKLDLFMSCKREDQRREFDLIKSNLKLRSSVNMRVCEEAVRQSLDVHSQHLIRRLIKRALGTK